MKKLILLLFVFVLPAFAQTTTSATPITNLGHGPAVKSTVPEISLQDTNRLLKLQLQFGNLSQQMQKLQADGKTLTDQYTSLTAGLCESTDGKVYTVELGPDPKCKEVPPAPKPVVTAVPAKK